jgi:hypothetical protein
MDPDGTLHNLRPIARLAVSGPDTEPRRAADTEFQGQWFAPPKEKEVRAQDTAATTGGSRQQENPSDDRPGKAEHVVLDFDVSGLFNGTATTDPPAVIVQSPVDATRQTHPEQLTAERGPASDQAVAATPGSEDPALSAGRQSPGAPQPAEGPHPGEAAQPAAAQPDSADDSGASTGQPAGPEHGQAGPEHGQAGPEHGQAGTAHGSAVTEQGSAVTEQGSAVTEQGSAVTAQGSVPVEAGQRMTAVPLVRPEARPAPEATPDAARPGAERWALSAADLEAIRWRLDGGTLREVVDDPSALRELGERLDGPLAEEIDNVAKAGLLSVRAEVYRLLGELGMAAAASRLALAHAESAQHLQSVVIAQAELAHVLRLRRDFPEADRLFAKAMGARVPDALLSVVHENAGRSCFDQGRHMEALDHFARAVRLGRPDDTDLAERVGVCLESVYIHVLRDGWGPYPRKPAEILGEAAPVPGSDEPTAEQPLVVRRR